MEHIKTDAVVVGAGIVGLAIARELAASGVAVVILESETTIGSVTSARNSGVVHAGLYYKPGSLKARFCVAGRDLLYAYAEKRNVWHQRCGKIVVATKKEQIEALHNLKKNAEQNGVSDLRLMTSAEACAVEPELSCVEAMDSPSSGQIDVHGLLEAFQYDAEENGAILQCQSQLTRVEPTNHGFVVHVRGPNELDYAIDCDRLINAAGLAAQKTAGLIDGFDPNLIPQQLLGKGNYFFLSGQPAPFHKLIYPLPVPGSSGLHYRRDPDGRALFGPDLELIEDPAYLQNPERYQVNPQRLSIFFESVRLYFPKLRLESLQADYAGIRPKLKNSSDFIIQTEAEHKMPGLINLFGIDSPGLTSCMALAQAVADHFNQPRKQP